MHYSRWRKHGDPTKLVVAPKGSGYVRKGKYRIVWAPDVEGCDSQGYIAEHRLVMQRAVGRPLQRTETVHHRNGVTADNRLENLELRIAAHPQGLSVDEAVAWAREILERYVP